jgi:hypothetical protein
MKFKNVNIESMAFSPSEFNQFFSLCDVGSCSPVDKDRKPNSIELSGLGLDTRIKNEFQA